MILKAYNIIKSALKYYNDGNYHTQSIPTIKSINGDNITTVLAGWYSTTSGTADETMRNQLLWDWLFFKVGTGTTEPTPDDYCLEEDVTSSFTSLNLQRTLNYVGSNQAGELTLLLTGKNNTNADIILNEIGIGKSGIYLNNDNYTQKDVLFIRHLFDEPLTVPPNETFKITLVWKED